MTEFFVFLSGFAIECACVFWVHFSERHAAFRTALCSVVIGTAQVYGYTEFVLHDFGPWFVLGYGVGTYSAIRGKSWWLAHQKEGLIVHGGIGPKVAP